MPRKKDYCFEMTLEIPFRAYPGEEREVHDEIYRKIRTLVETCFDTKIGSVRDCKTGKYRKI